MAITLTQVAMPASQSANTLYSTTTTPQATFTNTPAQNSLIIAALILVATSGSISPNNALSGTGLVATDKTPYAGTHSLSRVGLFWKAGGASEGKTFGLTTPSSQGSLLVMEWALGGTPVYDVGGTNERPTAGTTLSVPTDSAIAQAEELAIAVFSTGGSDGGNFSWPSFTSRFEAFNGGIASKVTSGVAVVTSAPTWPSSVFASGLLGTWRVAAASGRPKYAGVKKPMKYAGVEKPVKRHNGTSWVALS